MPEFLAKFLTKTESEKCNNTQNILLDGCYLLFEEYLEEKNVCLYPEPYRQIGQCLEESLPGGSLVKNLKTF